MRRSRTGSIFLLWILLAGCGGGGDDSTAPDPALPAELAAALDDLAAVHVSADSLLSRWLDAAPDTSAALDSLAARLLSDPTVASCVVTEQGVAVGHASGLRSAVVLDFADHPEINALPAAYPADGEPAKGRVTNPRTGLVNPHYHERQYYTNWLLERYDAAFPRIEFDQPERYFDAEATVEKFTSLDGYGVLHLYSHGVLMGGGAVGLLTGEEVNRNTNVRFASDLENGRLAIIHPRGRADQYVVLPEFVTAYNDFAADSTLVWGGFCYSGLGDWPRALVEDGARGYFGFDYSVYTAWNAGWASSVMNWLTDPTGVPRTVREWFEEQPLTPYYWNPAREGYVHCMYWGDEEAVLWKLPDDYSVASITEVQIHLDGMNVQQVWNDEGLCGPPYEQLLSGYVNRGYRIFGSTAGRVFSATFDDSDIDFGTVTVTFDAAGIQADSLVIHETKIQEALGYRDEMRLTFYDLPLVAADTWPGGANRLRFETDCSTTWPKLAVRREDLDSDCVAETQGYTLEAGTEVLLWFTIPLE